MYAVIMAGGGGTRLWPLSRATQPKPFLPLLDGGRTLLAATVERLAPSIGPSDIFVVTDARYEALVGRVAPDVPRANIIAEPMGRNTAAAIALAAHAVERPGDDVMIVLPADQVVRDEDGLRIALSAAVERASRGDLVTLGVEPSGPATGYGYVVAAGKPEIVGGRRSYRVDRFEEKPTPARARELIGGGSAWWNAGTFIWRRDVVMDALARHAEDVTGPIGDCLASASWAREPDFPWPGERLAAAYAGLRSISIDYALMEPAAAEGIVAVVPMSVGWDDLGSWSALAMFRRPGATDGNVIDVDGEATALLEGSRDVLVHAAAGRLVAIVGATGLVVVDTPDALLVCTPESAQDVRAIVDRLRGEGRTDLL